MELYFTKFLNLFRKSSHRNSWKKFRKYNEKILWELFFKYSQNIISKIFEYIRGIRSKIPPASKIPPPLVFGIGETDPMFLYRKMSPLQNTPLSFWKILTKGGYLGVNSSDCAPLPRRNISRQKDVFVHNSGEFCLNSTWPQ